MIRDGVRRAFHLALGRGGRWKQDVDDEIALHLALRAEQLIAEGMPRDQAVTEAVRRFGAPSESRARLHDAARHREHRMHNAEALDNLKMDIGFALRTLRRQKGWTAVTILTLALGIGATTAVFSVVSSLLLDPLPYPNAGRIVFVSQQPSEGNNTGIQVRITPSAPWVRVWKAEAKQFESIEGYKISNMILRANGGRTDLNAARIEPTFPSFAGRRPILGRMFTKADIATRTPVAVLGETFWRTQYGADPSVIGRTISLNDSLYTIVGVLPRTLQTPAVGASPRDVWVPLDLSDDRVGMGVIGRLRPGATTAEAARELDSLFARSQSLPNGKIPFRAIVTTPAQTVDFHDSLIMLTGAVALVLLVAFANVAHLMIARASSRRRELAIRAALGAGRPRLLRQLVTESLVLTLVGAACGVAVGWAGLRALIALRPASLSDLQVAHLDGTTLMVALAVAVFGGVTFGVVGAIHARRSSTNDALKSGAAGGSSLSRGGARAVLVVSEMALSTVLVVCATMVIRSVANLQQADLGFSPKHLYAVTIAPPPDRYGTEAARTQVASRIIERLRRMPGVQEASITGNAPGQRSFNIGRLEIEGQPPPPATSSSFIDVNEVEPGYFRTMGIPLVAGTTFTDTTARGRQIIVNATFARANWPQGAIGRRLRMSGRTTEPWMTIVGVAADATTSGPRTESKEPLLYSPATVSPSTSLMLRMSGPTDPTPSIRAVVNSIDGRVELSVTSIEQQLSRGLAAPRFVMLLLSIFTVLALVLAAIGLYGVMAFAVAQRTREIGIRVALGATLPTIARTVVAGGLAMAIVGAALGLVGATWGTKLIEHQLYGVGRSDVASFVVAIVVLLGAAGLACVVPTRRAVGVDPIRAIRAD